MRTDVFVNLCGVVLVGLVLGPVDTAGQTSPGPGRPAAVKRDVQVIPLKHTSAEQVAATLQVIFGGGGDMRIGVDPRTNAILVFGASADLASIEKLIKTLDVEGADQGARHRTHRVQLVPMANTTPDDGLQRSLQVILQGTDGSFAIDSQRRMVILSGGADTLEAATKVLQQLDAALVEKPIGPEYQVRLVWLASGPGPEGAAKPPADLAEVVTELAKIGIDRPWMAAQSIVNANPNATFGLEGSATLDAPCLLTISGMLFDNKPNPVLEIDIRANRVSSAALCNLHTRITTPIGHAVVLGVTPTERTTSVFVVQVLRRDTAKSPRK